MAPGRPQEWPPTRTTTRRTQIERFLPYILAAAIAYLIGSIPSGYLVARIRGNVDLLRHGSGRTGSANVLRTLGWKAAAPVFLGDFSKGAAAVAAARLVSNGDPMADLLAGLAAMFGHNYSVFIGFKGGRGVSTGLGATAVIAPAAMAVAAVLFVSTIALSRYVSLGSILGACSVPVTLTVLVLYLGQSPVHLAFGILGALFVVVSHKDNIGRLVRGTERKFGEKVRT